MVKMNEMTDKDFEDRKPYFDLGPHEVNIVDHRTGKANSGSEFIEFTVTGENGEEGKTTLWLTEKTVERTRSILAALAVHDKKTEAEKQKVRDAFKKITDSDQMLDATFLDKFRGLQAWILVEEDTNAPKPNGGYYSRANLYSYPPKPRVTDIKEDIKNGDSVDLNEIPFE